MQQAHRKVYGQQGYGREKNLNKIAEVAGRRIKKLRRNWSIKKEDLSRGLSKFKKSSKTLIEDVYNSKEGNNV